MLTGIPPTVTRKSVPWSRLNPRRKYWLAFPSPLCWVTMRPGTVSSSSPVLRMGRIISSLRPVAPSEAEEAMPRRFCALPVDSTPSTLVGRSGALGLLSVPTLLPCPGVGAPGGWDTDHHGCQQQGYEKAKRSSKGSRHHHSHPFVSRHD